MVIMGIGSAAVFGTSIRKYSEKPDSLLLEERQYSVIEKISRIDGLLGAVKLGEAD